MAKAKVTDTEENISFDSALAQIRKDVGSDSFENSRFGKISHYIDTGDLALNRIISGSVFGGIPAGRITLVAGESQSGKSYVAAKLAANALLKNNYERIFYLDTEGGVLKSFFDALGCDTNKIEHVFIESIEDAIKKVAKIYETISKYQEKKPDAKFLFVFDSIGAIDSDKVLDDIMSKDDIKADMGAFAKLCKKFFTMVTHKAIQTDSGMVIVNHVYDDPMNPHTIIKNQRGGKGAQFMPRVIIQCSKVFEKNEEQYNTREDKMSSTILSFMCVKNLLVKPFYKTQMYLNFSKGSLKYYGLVDAAKKYGFIIQKGAWYEIPSYSDKMVRLKDFLNNDEIWQTFLPEFNAKSEIDMSYSGNSDMTYDDMVNEIDEDDEDDIKES